MRARNREGIGQLSRLRRVAVFGLVLGVFSFTACAHGVYVCHGPEGSTVFRGSPCDAELEVEVGFYTTPRIRVIADPCLYAAARRGDSKPYCEGHTGPGASLAVVAPPVTAAVAVEPPDADSVPSTGAPSVVSVQPKDLKPGGLGDLASAVRYNLGQGKGPPGTITPVRR